MGSSVCSTRGHAIYRGSPTHPGRKHRMNYWTGIRLTIAFVISGYALSFMSSPKQFARRYLPTHTQHVLASELHPGSPTGAAVARVGVDEPGSPTGAAVVRVGVDEPGLPATAGFVVAGVDEPGSPTAPCSSDSNARYTAWLRRPPSPGVPVPMASPWDVDYDSPGDASAHCQTPVRYEFKGDRLGTSLTEFAKKHPHSCVEQNIARHTLATCEIGTTIVDRPVQSATFRFADGKLYFIGIVFPRDGYEDTLAAIRSKYGAASQRRIEHLQNGFGALWSTPVSFWLRGSDSITLAEHEDPQEKSSLVITDEKLEALAASRLPRKKPDF